MVLVVVRLVVPGCVHLYLTKYPSTDISNAVDCWLYLAVEIIIDIITPHTWQASKPPVGVMTKDLAMNSIGMQFVIVTVYSVN